MHFRKGFVKINLKNKIFCGVDDKLSDGGKPACLFESATMICTRRSIKEAAWTTSKC